MYRSRFISLIVGFMLCPLKGTWANPPQTCKRLIPQIAKEVGVPPSLLIAIASVESRFEPYALNHAGTSLSFETPGEAFAYVEEQLSQGETNIDMGCMQINWQAHQSKINDPRELLIPSTNIRYAAKFLKTLYQELGTWAKAVAAYHSRKRDKGQDYLIKVSTYLIQERRQHVQRDASTHNSGTLPFYRPDFTLVWPAFLYSAFYSGLYTKRLPAYYSCRHSSSISCSALSPLVSN